MKAPNLSPEVIEEITNEDLNANHWELRLGIALVYEYAPKGIKYSAAYAKLGKALWRALRYELYEMLCDPRQRKPKEWLNDLVTGDIRHLLMGITTAITSKYDVSLGIAVPCTALVAKIGVLKYCGTKPRAKPVKSVAEILAHYRTLHAPKKQRPSSKKAHKFKSR